MIWTRHDPEPMRETVDGTRFYAVPEVGLLPSVTTVLNATGGRRWALETWQANLGAREAEAVARIAAERGHVMHWQAEAYFRESRHPERRSVWWRSIEPTIEHLALVSELLLCEGAVWSEEQRAAGTPDLVLRMDGRLVLLDLTSAPEEKKRDALERKGVQLGGYADLIEAHYGERPELGIIIVGLPDRPAQVRRVQLSNASAEWRKRLASYWA